jgi:hypothetical protein
MTPPLPTWRVLRSQQDLARSNARQALLVIQQRRREQAESDAALPLPAQRDPEGRHLSA